MKIDNAVQIENDDVLNGLPNIKKRKNFENRMGNRRKFSLTLFTLSSSKQEKLEILNKLYDYKQKEEEELKHLYETTHKIVNHRKNNLKKNQICFTTNTYEAFYSDVIKRRSSFNCHHSLLNKKLKITYYKNSRTLSSSKISKFCYHLFSRFYKYKRILDNPKQNIKIHLLIITLFLLIISSVFFSFFRLINKTNKR